MGKEKTYQVRSRFKGFHTKGIVTGGWHPIKAQTERQAKNIFRKGTNFKLDEIQVKLKKRK